MHENKTSNLKFQFASAVSRLGLLNKQFVGVNLSVTLSNLYLLSCKDNQV